MKTLKFAWVAIIAIVGLAGFTACDNGGDDKTGEQPKQQTATLEDVFGEGITVTVSGFLTDTQWAGVADKVATALNGAYETTAPLFQNALKTAFENNDVIIIVEKTNNYYIWKTMGDKKTLYVNCDNLDSLQSEVVVAVGKMYTGNSTQDMTGIGSVGGIPVWRADGISVADGKVVMGKIENVYSVTMAGSAKDRASFVEKVKSIHVVSGNVLVWDGTTLKVGVDVITDTLERYIYDILDGLIEP